jgi:methylase of polypeptide subunit release factors
MPAPCQNRRHTHKATTTVSRHGRVPVVDVRRHPPAGDEVVDYLGLEIAVPHGVFAPTPTSDLLGRAVLAEVRETDRVLDMGTGSGINAILAASRTASNSGRATSSARSPGSST